MLMDKDEEHQMAMHKAHNMILKCIDNNGGEDFLANKLMNEVGPLAAMYFRQMVGKHEKGDRYHHGRLVAITSKNKQTLKINTETL